MRLFGLQPMSEHYANAACRHLLDSKVLLDDLLERFAERAEDIFVEEYYAAADERTDDDIWYADDAVGEVSPHLPHPLSYLPSLAQSVDLQDLIAVLESNKGGYPQFCEAVVRRATMGGEI